MKNHFKQIMITKIIDLWNIINAAKDYSADWDKVEKFMLEYSFVYTHIRICFSVIYS